MLTQLGPAALPGRRYGVFTKVAAVPEGGYLFIVAARARPRTLAIRARAPLAANRASYAEEVLADAPIAYWRLGEAIGAATAVDRTGNGHDGSYVGPPTLGAAGALIYDLDTAMSVVPVQYVTVPYSVAFDVASVTVEAWVRTTAQSQNGGIVDKTIGGLTNKQYLLFQEGPNWIFRPSTGGVNVSTPVLPEHVNAYIHVVGVADISANLTRIYLNGVEAATPVAFPGPLGTGNGVVLIGTLGSNIYRRTGRIDEVAIYGSVLSPERILAHYRAAFIPIGGFVFPISARPRTFTVPRRLS